MALIDKIQQNLATAGSAPVGTTDQTGRARTLLAAKSGKQLSTSASAPQSAIAESAAVDQTRQGMAEIQPEGQLAAAGIGQQMQQLGAQETGARADLALRQQQMAQSNSIRKQQLLGDLSRDRSSLDLDRDKAKLEQLAHVMRLEDKKYMDTLEMEGQRKRLDNDLNFKDELQKSIMGSNDELLKKSLGNTNIMAANDRDFAKAMLAMDINAALLMANNEMKDAKAAAMIQGVGTAAVAGAGAVGKYQDKKDAKAPTGNVSQSGTNSNYGQNPLSPSPTMVS